MNNNKKQKYIQAPTSEDLVRIKNGEKFSDITAGPLKKAFNGALEEDISELEALSKDEEQSSKPKRKTFKRSMYFILGIFVTVMSIIGIFFTTTFCIDLVKRIADNTEQKNMFAKIIYPAVVVDVPTYEEGSKLPPDVILTCAIWNIIINEDKSKYTATDGLIAVPQSDVEVEATKLFGTGLTFNHQTIGDSAIYFDYNADSKSYSVPVSPHYLPYSPKVEEIKKLNDNKFELTVGYYPPTQAWLPSGTKAVADKYMIYTVEKQNNSYVILSVKADPNSNVQHGG